jgi:hypothetical protein
MDAPQQFRRCKSQLPQAFGRATSRPRRSGAPFPARGVKVGHTQVASNHEPSVFGASRQSNPKIPYSSGRSRAPRANGVAARLIVGGQFLKPPPAQGNVIVNRPRGRRECQLRRCSSNRIVFVGTKGLVCPCVGMRAARSYTISRYNFKFSSSLCTLRQAKQQRMQPNPSVKRSANGLPPVPGRLWVRENLSRPGPGGKPSSPAYLER